MATQGTQVSSWALCLAGTQAGREQAASPAFDSDRLRARALRCPAAREPVFKSGVLAACFQSRVVHTCTASQLCIHRLGQPLGQPSPLVQVADRTDPPPRNASGV